MALKATIYKADLQIADMDRNFFTKHKNLTIARHPSETDERMMVRVLAFARHAHEALSFTKGLFDTDEPDLWQKDLTGAIALWIEVGQPDDKRLLKACGRAEQVVVYSYASNSSIWWNQIGSRLERAKNLTVFNLPTETSQALQKKLAQRNMQLQCTIQDGQIWMTGGDETVQIDLVTFKAAAEAMR
ncbi:YaeQ family protein [Undibacterium arcticum]